MSNHFASAPRSVRRFSRRGWSRPAPLPLRLEALELRDVPSFTFPLSGTTWREMGPRNIAVGRPGESTSSPGDIETSGRVTDTVVHPTDPNIFYVATSGGGVAKTSDGGKTWQHLTDRLPPGTPGLTEDLRTLTMGAITLSKLDPNIVYAGEGEGNNAGDSYLGNGILKSLDGGLTWQLITGPGAAFVNTAISKIITVPNPAAPTDPDQELVFVAVQEGASSSIGVWRSKDGGNSWAKISSRLNSDNIPDPIPDFAPYTDIAVDPSNPEIVYAAIGQTFGTHLYNGLYKTTHALSDTPAAPGGNGTEWKVVFGGNGSFVLSGALISRTKFVLAPSSPSTLYADVGPTGGVWRSTNGGTDWQKFATTGEGGNLPPFNDNDYNIGIAVDPTNPNRLVLVGSLATMVQYTENALASDPTTLEPAAIWSNLSVDPQGQGPHVDAHAVTFGPIVPGDPRRQLWLGSDGGIFRTQTITPGGNGTFAPDWASANGVPGPYALDVAQFVGLGLHPTSPDLYIGGTQDNGELLFRDEGKFMQSFDPAGNPITVTQAHYSPLLDGGDGGDVVYDFINPNNVYHVAPVASRGTAGFIRKSTDGGATWANAANGIINPNATLFYPPIIMDPSQSFRLFVGTDDVNETTDRAASWHEYHSKALPFVTGLTPVDGGPKPVVTAMGMSRSNPSVLYVAVLNRAFGSPLVSWGPAIYQMDVRRDIVDNGEADWHDISPVGMPPNGGPSFPRGFPPAFNTPASFPGDPLPPLPGAPPAPVLNDLGFFENITALTVDPYDWRIVYATSDEHRIMKTIDGGVTWMMMNDAGLPDGPTQQTFQDVAIDPNLLTAGGQIDDDLYIATNIGVYKLTDPTQPFANQQWVRLGDAPYQDTPGYQPDARVNDIEINTSLGILASATYGRGIWQFSIRPYISGIVFEDVNGDGVDAPPAVLNGPDPEPAVVGVRVVATDITPSHPGTPFEAANTTSDAKGFYVFRSLENGTYTIRPSDLSVSGKETLASTNPVDPTTKYQVTTPPRQYTIDQRFTEPNAHIGVFQRTTISGVKFDDTNGNGVRDAGEPGLGGWVLQLLRSDTNAVLATTTTAADGKYTFTGLGRIQDTSASKIDPATGFPVPGYPAIPFRVREVLQSGWVQTSFNPGDITLTSNTPKDGVDFGNFKLVSIAGTVYEDIDGDGTLDTSPAEPGLTGWEVKLYNVTNLSVPLFTLTTGAGGTYSFNNLGPGTYRIRETQQTPTWRQTSLDPADLPAVSGKSVAGINFGNFRAGGFTGVAFEDKNGNGVRDGNETTVVPGATVALFDSATNKLLATTTTSSTGVYTFTGLFPLTQGNTDPYRATITGPSNFAQTTLDQLVTVQSNTVLTGKDIGLFKRTSISGFAFEDFNGNGVQDVGDPAFVNGSVALLNAATGAVVTTTTTDANGSFTFTDLGPIQDPPGGPQVGYLVTANPAGFVQTTPTGSPIFLQSGIPTGGIQIGLFRLVQFSGQSFTDVDGNGVLDAGEPGLPGQTVQLVNAANGTVASSTVTDSGGFFTLNAGPGTWTLRQVAAAGSIITTPLPGNTPVTSGLVVPPTNFGNFQLVTVSGLVFNDRNGNGVFDANDQRLNGWAVQLVRVFDGAVLQTQVTPSSGKNNGEFFFANIGPGTYRVQEVLQAPYVPSITGSIEFAARSGQNLTVPFGNFAPAAAAGRVFEDLDLSGKLDGSEVGLAGFTVQVLNAAGITVSTGLTDAAGRYTAGGLAPGTYTAVLATPPGWVRTNPDPAAFTVFSGDTFAVADLGVLRLGSMAGSVFLDTNRNGRREAFERGIAGATVVLLNGAGAQVGSRFVGADGRYEFLNLQPGVYTTKLAALPPGFALSGASAKGQYTAAVSTGSSSPNNNLVGLDFGMIGRKRYALGADGGGGPRVQVYDAVSGDLLQDFFVYEPTFTGGVRVATGDVTGDGIDDLAVVAGPGGGPRLRVLDGVTGAELYNFFTYEPTFRDGLYVALGDVNGDGFADMVTGTSPGGGPRVTVYSGRDGTQIADYFAYGSDFRGGVRVAAGDTDGDGVAEVITAPGVGAIPNVLAWGGAPLAPKLSFLAFDPSYIGGVFVGSGPAGPSGHADILVGSGLLYPGTPVMRAFNGQTGDFQIEVPAFDPFLDGTPYQSEVRVTSFDRNGDNVPDYVIASGPGSPPRVRFLDGRNRRQLGAELQPYETSFVGGLYVG